MSSPADAPEQLPLIVNRPVSGRLPPLRLGELWTHRELAYFFALRDVKVRYKQAFLGVAWAILQPAIGAAIFYGLFQRLASVDIGGRSYFAFAIVGFGAWTYFSGSVQMATSSLLHNADLLSRVAFPRIIPPTAVLLPGLIDLSIATVLALAVTAGIGSLPSLSALALGLPIGLLLLVLAAAGPGYLLSASMVKYRDVATLTAFALQFLLFVSPVAYPPEFFPERWQRWVYLNPLAGALGALRWAIVGTPRPSTIRLAVSATVGAALLVAGLLHFRRSEREFADVI